MNTALSTPVRFPDVRGHVFPARRRVTPRARGAVTVLTVDAGPAAVLLAGWQRAVHQARPTDAARYRLLVQTADDEPTWEDAEWL